MKITLSGEDGHTLFALINEDILDDIKKDLHLKTIDNIWFRPSFGRGAGPRKKNDEKGYSGFGECDALIEGLDENECRNFVFVESKRGDPSRSEVSKKELRYQFFLKFSLINAIISGAVPKKFGNAEKDALYYMLELHEAEPKLKEISAKLLEYYRAYKVSNKDRTNGWLIKKDSPDAPALKSIVDALTLANSGLRFKFLALGFTGSMALSGSRSCELFDDLTLVLNDSVSELFDFKLNLRVFFRNVIVDPTHDVTIPTKK